MATVRRMKLTFYGFPDNDPPNSNAIAYPSVHRVAGGVGTHEDPVTTATRTTEKGGQLAPGSRLYAPSLKKYLIIEDECASCSPDQIDVWIGGVGHEKGSVEQCELAWTPDDPIEVEIEPGPELGVDKRPFFDDQTGTCRLPEN